MRAPVIGELGARFSLGELAGLDENTIIDNEEDPDKYDLGRLAPLLGERLGPAFLFTHTRFYRRQSEFG